MYWIKQYFFFFSFLREVGLARFPLNLFAYLSLRTIVNSIRLDRIHLLIYQYNLNIIYFFFLVFFSSRRFEPTCVKKTWKKPVEKTYTYGILFQPNLLTIHRLVCLYHLIGGISIPSQVVRRFGWKKGPFDERSQKKASFFQIFRCFYLRKHLKLNKKFLF